MSFRAIASASPSSSTSASREGSNAPQLLSLAKPKKRRSKTGCFTCRTRKVKCDEAQPYCLQCTSAGRACEGYNHVTQPRHPVTVTVLPKSISSKLKHSSEDLRLLNLFHTECIYTISGHFPSELWTKYALQFGQTEPAILHATLAITALYEETEIGGRPIIDADDSSNESPARLYATEHYTKAIAHLREYLQSTTASPVITLIACFFFVALEALRGRNAAASSHIVNGVRICADVKKRGLLQGNNASEKKLLSNLDNTFVKMQPITVYAVEKDTSNDPKHAPPTHALRLDEVIECPAKFSSLPAAREAFAEMINQIATVTSDDYARHDLLQGPDAAVAIRIRLDSQLRRWILALDELIDESVDSSSPVRETSGTLVLRIFAKHASILLWSSLIPSNDTPLPRYTPDFLELMTLIERCQEMEQEEVRIKHTMQVNPRPPVFIMDMGVNSALHFIVTRCADHDLRMRALANLEATPRRELLWDSTTAATAARRMLPLRQSEELSDAR